MMKPIPISAAERIAKEFGYDQVIIVARKVGDDPEPHGEHVTTYGITKVHCDIAARAGDFLKYKVMGWVNPMSAMIQRKPRRIRMCRCPHCKEKTRLDPKGRGEDIHLTVCCHCYYAIENEKVESWLEDRP